MLGRRLGRLSELDCRGNALGWPDIAFSAQLGVVRLWIEDNQLGENYRERVFSQISTAEEIDGVNREGRAIESNEQWQTTFVH